METNLLFDKVTASLWDFGEIHRNELIVLMIVGYLLE